jgi:hypothetical protein
VNLSLVLNPAAAAAPANPSTAAPVSPEMASFQDFLTLVGLPPMATDGDDTGLSDVVPGDVSPDIAALTGNILPPALPVLPEVPETPVGASYPSAAAGHALVQAQIAGLPMPPVTAQQLVPDMKGDARPAAAAAQPATQLTGPLTVSIEAVPVAAGDAPRVAGQPVTAQLIQAQQLLSQGGQGRADIKMAVRRDEGAAPLARAAAPVPLPDAAAAATARPVVRPGSVPAVDNQPPIAAPLPQVTAAAVQAPVTAATAAASTDAAPTRHDFEAVVDRLTEARDLARPGRADLHLNHREFGAVSVQFELAGQALKVAMSSPDQAFAPAVQAALAERPLAVAEAARADNGQQRPDTVSASSSTWHAGANADGQRGDGQSRSAPQRGPIDQPQDRRADDEQPRGDAASAGRFA